MNEAEGDEALILRCRLGPFDIALPGAQVVEVHRAVALDPIAGAPPSIAGVVDVRGELLAVLDLRHRFDLPPRDLATSDALVMVELDDRRLLLLVDEARSLTAVPADALGDGTEIVPGARFLKGVAATPEGPVVISDLGAFLSSDELLDLDAAMRALEADAATVGPS